MSIKGKRKELYIGKTECNIITFWGNKITIEYEDLKRIDYQYCAPGQSGYINFIDSSGKISQLYICELLVRHHEKIFENEALKSREEIIRAVISKSID